MTELTIRQIETATICSWPSITSAMDGMWLARFARGYTRRANSIQCLDPADDANAPARLQHMVELYLLNSRDPVFRVTPLAGPGVIAALDADDWVSEDGSYVLSMPLADNYPDGEARAYDITDPNFTDAIAALMEIDRRSQEIMTVLFGLIAYRNAGLLIRDAAGDPVAGAVVVNASGIATLYCVVVRDGQRGKGLGRQIMTAALGWAREVGATYAALQVLSNNAPAVRLYTSLGFREAYRYHYRRPS